MCVLTVLPMFAAATRLLWELQWFTFLLDLPGYTIPMLAIPDQLSDLINAAEESAMGYFNKLLKPCWMKGAGLEDCVQCSLALFLLFKEI